jgi:hypothetical protein
MTKPLNPKEMVTTQELAISNMLEIEALRQLLFEKGIITEEEFIERYKSLDRTMKEKEEGKYSCRNSIVLASVMTI